MSTYWVYIMASHTGTLYIGMTNNLKVRVYQHKYHQVPGFTEKYNCTKLIFFESYNKPLEAISREKQLKKWGRSKKEQLIKTKNPHWVDLNEEI